jgi:hypothetical protein
MWDTIILKKEISIKLAKNIEEDWPRTSKKLGQNLAKTSKESSKFLSKFFKVLGKVLRSSWPSFSIFFQRNFEFLFEWFEPTKSFSKMRTFPDPHYQLHVSMTTWMTAGAHAGVEWCCHFMQYHVKGRTAGRYNLARKQAHYCEH